MMHGNTSSSSILVHFSQSRQFAFEGLRALFCAQNVKKAKKRHS